MKHLSKEIVENAKQQLYQGRSVRQVATNLKIAVGSAVNIRNANKENLPPPKMGRPSKVSKDTRKVLARQFNNGSIQTIQDGQRIVQAEDGEQVHARTVRRHLQKEGLKAYVQQKKPGLTLNHRKDRLAFAKAHLHWTVDDWKNVMFSDETTISRVGSFGKKFYYCTKEHKRLQPHQVKETKQSGGGKIMVWGCMTYRGVGDAAWVPGKIDAAAYLEVLKDYVLASRDWYGMDPEAFIFQQDNASVHTARIVRDFFDESNLTVLEWPANSPDINPIENLWSYLKRELDLYKEAPRTLDELWERVQEVWTNIPISYIQKLYESMPRRMEEVVRNRGGCTKY
jgi:transposase/RNAse (barnase) inhibitor barstar